MCLEKPFVLNPIAIYSIEEENFSEEKNQNERKLFF